MGTTRTISRRFAFAAAALALAVGACSEISATGASDSEDTEVLDSTIDDPGNADDETSEPETQDDGPAGSRANTIDCSIAMPFTYC
jgi:hypothetical protein